MVATMAVKLARKSSAGKSRHSNLLRTFALASPGISAGFIVYLFYPRNLKRINSTEHDTIFGRVTFDSPARLGSDLTGSSIKRPPARESRHNNSTSNPNPLVDKPTDLATSVLNNLKGQPMSLTWILNRVLTKSL